MGTRTAGLALLFLSAVVSSTAAAEEVTVLSDASGHKLQVEGTDFFVRGMNWGYVPIGENYNYSLWVQDEAFIEKVLHREMAMLRAAGVNSIRQYDDIPPKWVTWIYENYGIYTMINPLFGRYGLNIDGAWVPVTDYSDPRSREVILEQTLASAERFKDVEGVLFYVLGNENNYGLYWSSFEIEALPDMDQEDARARFLYSLMGEAVDAIHKIDPEHPVAIANGDLGFLDLIAEEVPNLDIFGTNVYRGKNARDLYQRVEDTLGVPVVYTEFGADAFDAAAGQEDSLTQAYYVEAQWLDIYNHTYGGPGVGNAIGGYVFQWSDGWWKYKQTENLDIQDANASWPNAGYAEDFVEGRNNMNEEWFGICAKTPPDAQGHFQLQCREAYYTLQALWTLDPYAASPEQVQAHFQSVDPARYSPNYAATSAASRVQELSRVRLSNLRMELDTVAAGTDPGDAANRTSSVDHQESFYLDFAAEPAPGFTADLSLNILAGVAENQINEIQYETRGRGLTGTDADGGTTDLSALERLDVNRAAFQWDTQQGNLEGFYRSGHYHWAAEGDIFGLYREAYYGPNLDMYNGEAPIGLEFTGKDKLEGLAVAAGPQLWWGANPAILARYGKKFGDTRVTLAHQEDVSQLQNTATLNVIPEQRTRVTALAIETQKGPVGVQLGGLMGGTTRLGQPFRYVEETDDAVSYGDSGYHVLSDEIRLADTLGGRARVTYERGNVHLYAQGGYRGLVADAGGDPELLFTGWTLKESGRGNQMSALAGAMFYVQNWQFGPNFLRQKPLVGPLPSLPGSYDSDTGYYLSALKARNVLEDPFVVLGNRETTAFELIWAYDPTPGTWMWNWDGEYREDAPFAFSTNAVYRIQPTSRDALLGFSDTGALFAFAAAPEAANVWDVNTRAWFNFGPNSALLLHAYVGQGQATGEDSRLVTRYGGDAQLGMGAAVIRAGVKVDDWGPYDYHRVFNQTFPLQLEAHASYGLRPLPMEGTTTRIGIEGRYRTLDEYSPAEDIFGSEWEIRSVIHVSL